MLNTCAARLRSLRLHHALSQAELADRARVSRTTVIRLERGDQSAHPATLRKLAHALKVKPHELMDDGQ
jgi:transcriptional regulator with XRE-family HTH domain